MKLSIIIPSLNDHAEANATVASIRETAGNKVEIIVIDDCSDTPLVLEDIDALLYRNPVRVGAGGSRHIGAEIASGTHFLLLDSHMRFEPGWHEKAMARITGPGRENVVHCGSCLGLEGNDMFMEEYNRKAPWSSIAIGRRIQIDGMWAKKSTDTQFIVMENEAAIFHDQREPEKLVTLPQTTRYYGAQMNICGPNPNNPSEHQVYEGVWAPDRFGEDDYEISCLMGACYFFSKEWFFHIGGLKANKHWGSEEPYLALKTYLSGGSVRMMKGVRVGHKFHSGSSKFPYKLYNYWKHYNKIRSIMTTTSPEETSAILPHLFRETDIKLAMSQIQADQKEIIDEMAANAKIFKHDLKWYCDRFSIKYPVK